MSFGLQIFRADGSLSFDNSFRLARYFSQITVSVVPAPTSTPTATNYTVAGMVADGSWGVLNIPEYCSVLIQNGFFTLYVGYFATSATVTIHVVRI
jgi:hypothetical protein